MRESARRAMLRFGLGSCSVLVCASVAHAQAPAPPTEAPAPTPAPAPAPAPAAAEPQIPVQVEPSSDELAAPEEALPTIVTPPAPEVEVVRTPSRDRFLPIRAERRLALMGELGWNGLAGFGPTLTYHVTPHVSFDLGAGLAVVGWKVGLRGRYNFMTGPVTPFLGAGFMGATGWGDSALDLTDPNTNDDKLNIKVLPSAFFQGVVGVDWTTQGGFTLLGALGYAALLSRNNVQIITGEPTDEQREGLRIAFRSSPVISLGLGYSFK